MKFNVLQKFLIKLGIICGAIIIGLGLVYYFISDYRADTEQELSSLKVKLTTTNTQLNQMQKKLSEYKEAQEFYIKFASSGNADSQNFRRDFAKNLLAKLNDQNGLVDLKFNMEQFQKMGGSFETKNVSMYSSKVTVQYTANSDIDSYNFIKSVVAAFPGTVHINSYSIKTAKEITIDLLTQLAGGATAPGLVTGELIFDWRGIQDNPEASAKPADKPQGPNSNSATPQINPMKRNLPNPPAGTNG